ncbi:MAG: type II secretion system GspH family protein [Alphaproteobacteria bacterium]|nr:type II secretion system GspH family protein [Alphaproteobacteria bacterium]
MTRAHTTMAGYTLLELLVVLSIIALIAVVAIPAAGGSVERMTLSSDARAMTTQLRRLREQALDTQSDIVLTVSGSAANVANVSGAEAIAMSSGTSLEISPRFTIAWDGTVNGTMRLSRGDAAARIVADRLTGRLVVEASR